MIRTTPTIGLAALFVVLLVQPVHLNVDLKEKAKLERVLDREESFYAIRAYPFKEIPVGARLRAIAQLERSMQIQPQNSRVWQPLGPSTVPNGQPFNLGRSPRISVSGRATSVLVDPNNRARIYLGTAQGGVWRSDDSGASWQPITDNLPSLAVGALAFDPNNSNTIYLGTGEAHFSSSTYYGAGIFKSTDGGQSWQPTGQLPLRARISTIAVDPSNSQTVFAATALSANGEAGVYKSTDGGQSWRRTLEGTATELSIDPANPSNILAALGFVLGNSANGVYRSTDGGESWQQVRALPTGFSTGRVELGRSRSTPNIVFASFSNTNPFTLNGLYKSTDNGITWTKLSNVPDYCSPQCFYNNVIAVHPRDHNTVFLGGVGAYRSTDGGTTFTDISSSIGLGPGLHADNHAVAFDPVDPNVVYIANDGGIFRSLDLGNNWTPLNNSLPTFQFQSVALHPTNPQLLIGGTQDNGTLLYTGSPVWNNIDLGDGGDTAIDFNNPATFYHFFFYLLLARSDDGGQSFALKIDGLPVLPSGLPVERTLFYAPLTMDPSNPSTLYTGSVRVFRTTSKGDSWNAISGDLTNGNGAISAIAVASPSTIFVGSSDGKLSRSTDNGTNWQTLQGLPNRAITRIAVDPVNTLNVYAVVSGFGTGHVFRSSDGGTSWSDISDNLPDIPANAIALDPNAPHRLYVATDIGVFFSRTGSGGWVYLNEGLPRVTVLDLEANSRTGLLIAATHGRGMFALALDAGSDDSAPQVTLETPKGGENFAPGASVEIRWTASDDTSVAVQEIDLIDESGAKTSIASGLPGDQRSFIWTVPEVTVKARIRITARDGAGNAGSAESGLFSISTEPTATITRIQLASNGKLIVDGVGFKVGDSLLEVDSTRLQTTKYPKKFRQPDGSTTRLQGIDTRFDQLLRPGRQVEVSVISGSTGRRIARASFTP